MNMNAKEILKQKYELLSDYFRQNNLDSVVVGISGGVDSAVVGGMLAHFSRQQGSPIKRVVGVIAPIYTAGASNQVEAQERAVEVCERLWIEPWICDLTRVQVEYERVMNRSPSTIEGDKRTWANGQILSIARTPLFYGVAAHLQAEGFRSVVSGTTNRSEGSYIGFFGKASDGMCDIQPISDLWKRQVYALGAYLKVPQEVMEEAPRGDVWDARTDEEMIGASYDALEEYLVAREADLPHSVDPAMVAAIESLHSQNAHKYLVGSPAVHFDVLPRHIRGGWSERNTYSHKI